MRPATGLFSVALASLVIGGCADTEGAIDNGDPEPFGDGVSYDEENPGAPLETGKDDGAGYAIPSDLPNLTYPEIIVSLDGLTVHLFDRASRFSAVYPAGVGIRDVFGESITPTGHFSTGSDPMDSWWYTARRNVPSYFAGLPFLRLTAENSSGANTYGLHGPITERLVRGYVSHGCVRMEAEDIVELFWIVREQASVPVTIQKEVERDAAGQIVDLGTDVVLWQEGEEIDYGASVGPRL